MCKRKARVVRDATRLDPGWDDLAFAARVGAGFTAQLAALDADPAIDAILVATHVPLFEAQLARRLFQESQTCPWGREGAERRAGRALSPARLSV
jgi:hypothetical protein